MKTDAILHSEWAVNMHRDTLAAHVGHYPMTMFFAVAENESIGRVRYNLMQVTVAKSLYEFLTMFVTANVSAMWSTDSEAG